MTAVGEGLVGLLVPFLVIGIVAVVVGVVTLVARGRAARRRPSTPTPQPEPDWPGAPVEPLVERPVDLDRRWSQRNDPLTRPRP